MSKKVFIVIVIAGLLVGGVGYWLAHRPLPPAPTPAPTTPTTWSKIIKVGETVTTTTDNVLITLKSVNDSRCKKGVVCIWAGELGATIELSGGELGATSKEIVLGQTTKPEATEGPYTFSLGAVTADTAIITVSKQPR